MVADPGGAGARRPAGRVSRADGRGRFRCRRAIHSPVGTHRVALSQRGRRGVVGEPWVSPREVAGPGGAGARRPAGRVSRADGRGRFRCRRAIHSPVGTHRVALSQRGRRGVVGEPWVSPREVAGPGGAGARRPAGRVIDVDEVEPASCGAPHCSESGGRQMRRCVRDRAFTAGAGLCPAGDGLRCARSSP